MARPIGVKNKTRRASAREDYDVYIDWVKQYGKGRVEPASKQEFLERKELLIRTLKEEGKTTASITKKVASTTVYSYDIKAGKAIREAYRQYTRSQGEEKKLTLFDARRIFTYDSERKAVKSHEFWDMVSDEYMKLKQEGKSGTEAAKVIAETVFGSP